MTDDDLTTAYILGVEHIRDKMHKQADEIERLRTENETLRRDVKTAVMGDSAELRDVKRENEKLREALKPFAYYASQIPDDVSDTAAASGTVGDLRAAAAAIRESGNE